MKLSPRLQTIADFVDKDLVVGDIGTDHAYIPVYLVENNITNKIIASDVNKGPLTSARNYISSRKLNDNINTRLGNGLEILKPSEVDVVIIAGMGGLLINNILKSSETIANTITGFILQPMVASSETRKFLYQNNYKITNEKLAKEGDRFYEIIYAEHGYEELKDDIYFEIGLKLIENKDPLVIDFIDKKLRKIEKITENITKNNSVKGKEKYDRLVTKYKKLKEVRDLVC